MSGPNEGMMRVLDPEHRPTGEGNWTAVGEMGGCRVEEGMSVSIAGPCQASAAVRDCIRHPTGNITGWLYEYFGGKA